MAKTQTSTQIRNLYCDQSYLNISFYNLNLSLKFAPFKQKSANGMNQYDSANAITTSIDYAAAYALYSIAGNILNNVNDTSAVSTNIPINGGNLLFERKMENNSMETYLTVNKEGKTLSFKFAKLSYTKNGSQSYIDTGLGIFHQTLSGYLTGINADRHLDKLTEDYVKSLGGNDANNQNSSGGFNTGSQYKGNGNWKGNNRNNNWKNNGNKNWNNGNNQNNSWQPKQQNYSELNIQD